jgi:hypothetical protein
MRATTIKVEGELLEALIRAKPKNLSLSAFVRSILQREVLRTHLVDATERYTRFLRRSPEEQERLAEWERADLSRAPRRRRR